VPILTHIDIGYQMEEIRLAAGEEIVLSLPGLGSAGYQWFVVVQNASVARVVKLATPTGVAPGESGSTDEQFAIQALTAGQTVLWFTQRRSFQPERPPHAVREVMVRVE
jgi:predicted secreted protein